MRNQLKYRSLWIATVVIFSSINLITCAYDEYEGIRTRLELIDLDLQDQCNQLSSIAKTTYVKNPPGYKEKIKYERGYGKFVRKQAHELRKHEDVPDELQRNWTLLTSTGDTLLPEEDWQKAVVFANNQEEISRTHNVSCESLDLDGCMSLSKQDVLDILASSKNISLLENAWTSLTELYAPLNDRFVPVLNLTRKAAKLNKEDFTPKEYWDMLLESDLAPDKANELWQQIEPFYKKLHRFVKARLFNAYEITDNATETIPVYLLGTFFGEDWSNIADLVLPHPHFYREINRNLRKKSVEDLYRMADEMIKKLELPQLGTNFYKNSIFNASSCKTDVLSFCNEEYSEVMTCDKTNWIQYVEAHKTAMKIALRKTDDYILYLRLSNRISALNEALEQLSTIMALESLGSNKLLPERMLSTSEENYKNRMTALLMLALKVLPSLPYHLATDKWRLEELENPSQNPSETWWSIRQKYQSIGSPEGSEWDFLADENVARNKPNLGKFLGTFIQFQIMENLKKNNYYSDETKLVDALLEEPNFKEMILDKPNKPWPKAADFYYGIYDISAEPLLEFFQPLEEYMENASMEQEPEPSTTTTEEPTTTPKPTTQEMSTSTKVKNVPKRENIISTDDTGSKNIDSETTSANSVNSNNINSNNNNKNNKDHHATIRNKKTDLIEAGVYCAIGFLVLTAILLATYIIVKKRRTRRPVTGNRRFEQP